MLDREKKLFCCRTNVSLKAEYQTDRLSGVEPRFVWRTSLDDSLLSDRRRKTIWLNNIDKERKRERERAKRRVDGICERGSSYL
jgi:hypothetical protein